MINAMLDVLFKNKYDCDNRQPITLFSVPKLTFIDTISTSTSVTSTKIGLLAPSLSFWLQLFYVRKGKYKINVCLFVFVFRYIIHYH